MRPLRFLGFWLFPRWTTRLLLRGALWEAYVRAFLEAHGAPAFRFSAAEFDAWCWLWSERRRLEGELDRFVMLLDAMNQRNAQLKRDLAYALKSKETV